MARRPDAMFTLNIINNRKITAVTNNDGVRPIIIPSAKPAAISAGAIADRKMNARRAIKFIISMPAYISNYYTDPAS